MKGKWPPIFPESSCWLVLFWPGCGLGLGQHYLQRKELDRNLGDGKFEEVAQPAGRDLLRPRSTRGVALGDYDNDGDIDSLVAIDFQPIPTPLPLKEAYVV